MTDALAAAAFPIELADVPTIWRGQPFTWRLQLLQADGVTAQSLTSFGSTWAAMLRTGLLADSSIPFAVDTSHLADGYVELSLTAAQTTAMQRGRAVYSFDVRATGGTVTPFYVWTGHVSVDGAYTR